MRSTLLTAEESIRMEILLEQAATNPSSHWSILSTGLSNFVEPSYAPIYGLSVLLSKATIRWPVLELQQLYCKAWKMLPEIAKAGKACVEGQALLDGVLVKCKSSYNSIADLLHPTSSDIAVIDPESGRTIAHRDVAASIRDFSLPIECTPGVSKPVVAISLPNGPLLALTVLATATYYTAAPVAHGSGVAPEQFKTDVLQSRSNLVLASAGDVDRLRLRDSWLEDAGISVLLVHFSENMQLVIRYLDGMSPKTLSPSANGADDTGILLFTSGTSGTKKLVPLSIHSMVCGIAMVIESWGLSPSMRCLNQMPLNHVGGLIRNLFAPICSGGSVICCSAFDANLFWDCVDDYAPTWYYASPTMHQCILETGLDRPESVRNSQMRLVCNAAGGLLPSLACRLRDTFSTDTTQCTVLPSYGMTECMPISTPPLDYHLEKTGTSGISVGPEIATLDGNGDVVKNDEVGRICVRGPPMFNGYLRADKSVDQSCFDAAGWFDTGDMGYLDADGFLYLTGRSKEVINRGGELISPFEVEEAVVAASALPNTPVSGRIGAALAFSVTHDVLQEVVGVAVVTPAGMPRTCLRDIQDAVKSTLSQVKLPVLLVFMDSLPVNNGKLLRIRLAARLGLPDISDSTSQAERHYIATCPPPNTTLSQTIGCTILTVNNDDLVNACHKVLHDKDTYIRTDTSQFYRELFVAPAKSLIEDGDQQSQTTIDELSPLLHGYDRPVKVHHMQSPFQRHPNGSVDEGVLDLLLTAPISRTVEDLTSTETTIATIFSALLSIPLSDISKSSSFFDLGGSSMSAGQLLSKLRKEFQIRIPIDQLFNAPQICELAVLIDRKTATTPSAPTESEIHNTLPELLPGCEETRSSTRPMLMLIQLLPIGIFYPMKRAFTWTVFMYFLAFTQNWYTHDSLPGRLFNLVFSMAVGRIVTKIVAPLVAISMKWLLITHLEGLYPMWGAYHTRWWLCQKIISIAGFGMFGVSNMSRVWYYRLLGATIGQNVKINKGANLGEYDLITIGDNAVLERCTVRPFAAERNSSMYLGRLSVGTGAVVGLGSIVAAGTHVPEYACIGPNSSSWEVTEAADEGNRDLASSNIPAPHWVLEVFLGLPIQLSTAFLGALPWLGGLVPLVLHEPITDTTDTLRQIVVWFSSPSRVGFHYLALMLNAILGPAFIFAAVWLLKKVFDMAVGPARPCSADSQSQMSRFRASLLRTLMPAPQFHKLADLFGSHYEVTSHLARLMGARIGKRVYWPGTGPSIQDFALLDIGDDVVFGSRSHLVTSDGSGTDKVVIGNGAMVADRVVLLPGVHLGEKTVMGSGAMTKRNGRYADSATYVGSRANDAVCLSSNTTNMAVSNRASIYYDLPKTPYAYDRTQSTATTLVRSQDSEASSIMTVEKSAVISNSIDEEIVKIDNHIRRRSIITITVSKVNEQYLERGSAVGVSIAADTSMAQLEKRRGSIITVKEVTADTPDEQQTSSPFGRAFYYGLAPYRVWSQSTITCYSVLITLVCAVFWNVGSISTVQIIGHGLTNQAPLTVTNVWARPIVMYIYFTIFVAVILAAQTAIVLFFLIGAKWLLLGRRQAGNYDWDKSPYCQRWQFFLKLESLRRHCYGGLGILSLLTGTAWIVAYFRALGLKIGKDCALFAGGTPSLFFTEPDLLELGDRVVVDDASLVAHINTRGKFDLNELKVGHRSVLRSGSRLLSGAKMEDDTCLLEHTLVMAGDVVEAGCTSQGWPAEEFKGSRMPTLKVAQVWMAA
ncbi:putative NRPS-like protein biosynthetic cluster [Elasticomyces elasticus]|nr:putative NRPS-like protein biosynthetic cluster [Elasticomyces elasticus]